MIKYSPHFFRKLPYELLVFGLGFFFAQAFATDDYAKLAYLVAAQSFLCCFSFAIIRIWALDHQDTALLARDRVEAFESSIREYMKAKTSVDIWSYQESLMVASDQKIPPDGPQIHKGVLLYAALMMEELAETQMALAQELRMDSQLSATFNSNFAEAAEEQERQSAKNYIAVALESTAKLLESRSKLIRAQLSYLPDDWWFLPSRRGAYELLDGITDVAVVVAGFSLSAGFPGREAYDEVGSSNLSKANPITGRIEKDASGKWIKGSAYRAPDMAKVLDSQQQAIHAKAMVRAAEGAG